MGRLIHLVFSQGERYPVFIDEDGIPDFWITLYVTEILRASLKQTAIENTIRNLTHLKLWEEMNQRDLVSEFSQAKFLSEADIYSIRDHCLLSTRDLREWLELKEKMNVSKLRVSHPTSMSHLQSVSKLHSGNRLVHIASYLHFTARSMLRMRPNFISVTVQIDQMKKLLIAQKPKGQGGKGLTTDPDSKAPPPEVFEKLMSVIKVDSPDNPYKNQSIRLRNSLMFEVLYETGMRSGEVLGLQIGDVDFQENKISIARRHDNPDDPRKRQPVAKTLERDIPVNTDLVRRLRNYVMDVRSKMITAKTPPFLFITHKRGRYQGHPLSESTCPRRLNIDPPCRFKIDPGRVARF